MGLLPVASSVLAESSLELLVESVLRPEWSYEILFAAVFLVIVIFSQFEEGKMTEF
jgi:hypothetical protein